MKGGRILFPLKEHRAKTAFLPRFQNQLKSVFREPIVKRTHEGVR